MSFGKLFQKRSQNGAYSQLILKNSSKFLWKIEMNQPLYHTIPAPASIVSNSGIISGISDDNTHLKRSAFFNQKIRDLRKGERTSMG